MVWPITLSTIIIGIDSINFSSWNDVFSFSLMATIVMVFFLLFLGLKRLRYWGLRGCWTCFLNFSLRLFNLKIFYKPTLALKLFRPRQVIFEIVLISFPDIKIKKNSYFGLSIDYFLD